MSFSHFSQKRALLKVFGESGVFKAWALLGPAIKLSLLQTPMFWYYLTSLCVRQMDLSLKTISPLLTPLCPLWMKLTSMCACWLFNHVWLCDSMDCSPPGSSIHGILQARILEWVAILFSRGSSWLMVQTHISCIAGRFFAIWVIREALLPSYQKTNHEYWLLSPKFI